MPVMTLKVSCSPVDLNNSEVLLIFVGRICDIQLTVNEEKSSYQDRWDVLQCYEKQNALSHVRLDTG